MKKTLLLALVCAPVWLFSQGKISMADAILKGRTALAPANLKQLKWLPGTAQFTHVVGTKIVRVNAPNLATDTLDILPKINDGLVGLGLKKMDALPSLMWISGEKCWFQTENTALTYSFSDGLKKENWWADGSENTDFHEKTLNAAFTVKDELWVSAGGVAQQVAKSEAEGIVYGKSVHRDEYGISKGTFWSPSGTKLAFYRMDERQVTQYPIYVLDSMPAQVRQIRYPYAGATSHFVTVGVFDLKTGRSVYLQTGEPADQYLTNVAWSPDDKYVLVAVLNRTTDHCWLRLYDAATGAFVRTILEEKSDKWVEPQHPVEFVPGSKDEFIWQSQQDGFNHLYRWNLAGKMLGQVSRGQFPVTNFYGFDDKSTSCFFQAADESGLNRYVYQSDLKTGKMTRLTNDEGVHNCLINSAGTWVVDNFSNEATPRFIYAFEAKKPAERQVVFAAKNPLEGIATGLTRMVSIPSPGGPTLNGRLILPPDFDPKKKYPTLVYLYNGPHVQLVTNSWLGGAELWMHHMAEEGFVVFSMDGRGSANRGLAFEQAIHRQLGTAEIEDQTVGAKYLRAQSFVDSTRMGIFGWSYGGFMTTSMMTRPEAKGLFKCGVAGGPVIDWKMYEIMYTERYMDTPQENPDGYAKADLFKYIDNLNGRLLMIHGSSDDVVLWQHSLRYIRECVRKGKQIDYFVYPEHLHNVLGKDRVHLFEKIGGFFKENLQGRTSDSVRP